MLTRTELLVLKSMEGPDYELRVARVAAGIPELHSLRGKGFISEVPHDFGDHVAVFQLTPLGIVQLLNEGVQTVDAD